MIRRLFEERYGQRFAVDTAEFFPGNLLNFQVVNCGFFKVEFKILFDDQLIQICNIIATDKRETIHNLSSR